MPFSDFANNKALAAIFDGPVTLSLHTATPGDLAQNEVRGGEYRRQQLPFKAPQASLTENAQGVLFEGLPAVRITHYGFWNAAGKFLAWAPLNEARNIGNDGDAYQVRPGDITFGLGE